MLKQALIAFGKREYFTEFLLMGLATIGAFGIGEYPEAVAVMLFYTVGELFQSAAVNRAKGSIKALLEVRPTVAHVLRNSAFEDVNPESVGIGDTIQIKAGEKVPLDGVLISARSSFNTAALTGESKPKLIVKDEIVLAGMLNLDSVVELKVTKAFADSALSKILELVQNATANKAPTELLIRRLAKIYTPTIVALALALIIVPYFMTANYVFYDWLYRALVFLVISCPCALVISIPLGYFGGIGAASRHGILFKGANYLERMTAVNTVVMDKTGTLTEGVFAVQSVVLAPNLAGQLQLDESKFIALLAALERKSTHPIAKAVVAHAQNVQQSYEAIDVEEISGHGLKGTVDGKSMLAGNTKLLQKFAVPYDAAIDAIVETTVVVALDGQFAGYILIADKVKADAQNALHALRANGVRQLIMLSGDKHAITQKVAQQLGIDAAFGDLLPEQKVQKVEALKRDPSAVIAFVGDGINDAPVLALSDVGIAMGAMGSDAAIETANVVIQDDNPAKIAVAMNIGKATRAVVLQNIYLAFGVKLIVLVLGAGGLATMWEAVFADVGVAILAILNAVRIQRMRF